MQLWFELRLASGGMFGDSSDWLRQMSFKGDMILKSCWKILRLSISIVVITYCLIGGAPRSSAQMIVGHRGASFDAPENTVAAFQEAWRQGADGVEGDFYVTADQQIVCIHDSTTKRTAGISLKVAESTLAELRALEYGAWKDEKFRGEPLPVFADVLACVPPGKQFVIELKTGPEVVPLLKAELDRLQPDHSNLLIIAFNKETVIAARQQLPTIRAHWLTGYKQNKVTGVWHPTAEEVAAVLQETGAHGLGTQGNREVVTPEFIRILKAHGMKEFHVWTIDAPEDAAYFRFLGAIGITTNRPALIRSGLKD